MTSTFPDVSLKQLTGLSLSTPRTISVSPRSFQYYFWPITGLLRPPVPQSFTCYPPISYNGLYFKAKDIFETNNLQKTLMAQTLCSSSTRHHSQLPWLPAFITQDNTIYCLWQTSSTFNLIRASKNQKYLNRKSYFS